MKQLLLLVFLFTFGIAYGQQFQAPASGFSKSKKSVVVYSDGTEKEFYVDKIRRKKGKISRIVADDIDTKKSYEIDPDKISYAYLVPSGLSKALTAMDYTSNIKNFNKEGADAYFYKEGYVRFENVNTLNKKKKGKYFLQVVNFGFNDKIDVYADPMTKTTASVGPGSMAVAGGIDKSYYVKPHHSKQAIYVSKKNYKKLSKEIFKDCSALKNNKDLKWKEFTKHVIQYNECAR